MLRTLSVAEDESNLVLHSYPHDIVRFSRALQYRSAELILPTGHDRLVTEFRAFPTDEPTAGLRGVHQAFAPDQYLYLPWRDALPSRLLFLITAFLNCSDAWTWRHGGRWRRCCCPRWEKCARRAAQTTRHIRAVYDARPPNSGQKVV